MTFSRKYIQKYKFNCESFIFYENLSESEIHYLYSKVDALIYTSLVESLGMPLLETITHKKPIIAINLPYVKAAIKNFYYFEPNKKSLSNVIKNFKNDIHMKKVKIARSKINLNTSIFYQELLS